MKRSEDWQMRLVVSSNVYCFWVPSDYPVYLSSVTLTKEIANDLTIITFLDIKEIHVHYTFVHAVNPCVQLSR